MNSFVRDVLRRQGDELARVVAETKVCQACRAGPVEVVHRAQPVFDIPPFDAPDAMTVRITEEVRLLCAGRALTGSPPLRGSSRGQRER